MGPKSKNQEYLQKKEIFLPVEVTMGRALNPVFVGSLHAFNDGMVPSILERADYSVHNIDSVALFLKCPQTHSEIIFNEK